MDFALTEARPRSEDTVLWEETWSGRPMGWWWKVTNIRSIITWFSTSLPSLVITMDREVNVTCVFSGKSFATLEKRRRLVPKCYWVRRWRVGQLLANFFHLSLLTVPEVFAKINSDSFLFIIKWNVAEFSVICLTLSSLISTNKSSKLIYIHFLNELVEVIWLNIKTLFPLVISCLNSHNLGTGVRIQIVFYLDRCNLPLSSIPRCYSRRSDTN